MTTSRQSTQSCKSGVDLSRACFFSISRLLPLDTSWSHPLTPGNVSGWRLGFPSVSGNPMDFHFDVSPNRTRWIPKTGTSDQLLRLLKIRTCLPGLDTEDCVQQVSGRQHDSISLVTSGSVRQGAELLLADRYPRNISLASQVALRVIVLLPSQLQLPTLSGNGNGTRVAVCADQLISDTPQGDCQCR